MTGLDDSKDLGVRQVHARGIAGRRIDVERECFARDKRGWIGRKSADPELWTLQIEQNADRPTELFLDIPDCRPQLTHARMRGVTHIDAEDIGAGLEKAGDDASV